MSRCNKIVVSWICLLSLLAGGSVSAKETSPQELVERLGAPSFRKRAQAQQMLLRLGRRVVPALRDGLRSDDQEIVIRCRRLLGRLDRSEFELRLDEFVETGKSGKDLPGWEAFERIVGNTETAREDYALIVLADKNLVAATTGRDARSVRNLVQSRCNKLYEGLRKKKEPTYGQIGALLLAAGCSDGLDYREFTRFYSLLSRYQSKASSTTFRRLLAEALRMRRDANKTFNYRLSMAKRFELTEVVKKDLAEEVRGRIKSSVGKVDLNSLRTLGYQAQAVGVADELAILKPDVARIFDQVSRKLPDRRKLSRYIYAAKQVATKEVLPFLLKVASTESVRSAYRAMCLRAIAKAGGKKQIAQVEALLNDKEMITRVQVNGVMVEVQVGDVALATVVHLNGEKHSDYGFPAAGLEGREFATDSSYVRWGFANDEQRDKAFAKWARRKS